MVTIILCASSADEELDSNVPSTLLTYCQQVAYGLRYLSKKSFVHRDIAARNILITEDLKTCKVKLCLKFVVHVYVRLSIAHCTWLLYK